MIAFAFGAFITTPAIAEPFQQCGKASWYNLTSMTASGERANPEAMTAAHRTLPFGTKVKVVNLSNGRSVTVRINDRGPFAKGRVIDVTQAAAEELGFKRKGITRVRVVTLGSHSAELPSNKCQ
ncbi:septal ring lytic transglycosylase RlpA family protein [Roseibium denhamense]|nr:septal ring lytic transglycosylase RlpA family protein [Roseibium denhamense]MTI06967.1 septal ring lytic transglycosylase RlpA family protein [Roseibium denhamense]